MIIFTIGFTKSKARDFFERIRKANPDIIIDVRRNNSSQLAGFAKGDDLLYFAKEICNCGYKHDTMFAPSEELLDGYKHKKLTWAEYIVEYERQMEKKDITNYFKRNFSKYNSVCLLCSENTPEQCHRRLLAQKISKENGGEIVHL